MEYLESKLKSDDPYLFALQLIYLNCQFYKSLKLVKMFLNKIFVCFLIFLHKLISVTYSLNFAQLNLAK